jgi:hypothetical protein
LKLSATSLLTAADAAALDFFCPEQELAHCYLVVGKNEANIKQVTKIEKMLKCDT